MSTITQDLLVICEQLPVAQQEEVTDFARFLLARNEDAAWERTIADPRAKPKFDAFLKESQTEGSEPLDSSRL